jgi:predicted N-formylglutamate amidohydrolase
VKELYPPLVEHGENTPGKPPIVIVCEHATNVIPPPFNNLGLDAQVLKSHIAWDPGAAGVAQAMRRHLGADLVAGAVSRLIYDCNRPPEAPSATPETSEIFVVPGNKSLSTAEREARIASVYTPFHAALAAVLDEHQEGVLLTVHSFTPIYHSVRRTCEIGILHDSDDRLANTMLTAAAADFPYKLERNVPYSAADGVTHTLKVHGVARGWPNVMLEIRNDLIETLEQQEIMAKRIVSLINAALQIMKEAGNV